MQIAQNRSIFIFFKIYILKIFGGNMTKQKIEFIQLKNYTIKISSIRYIKMSLRKSILIVKLFNNEKLKIKYISYLNLSDDYAQAQLIMTKEEV